jgi:hypothetical protein
VGRWHFIVVGAVRAAITTAFTMIVVGLSIVAFWAHRDGQALDFQWFQLAGQPGAGVFHVYRHALMLLSVTFLFGLFFWLWAGAKCWWLNECVHREALAKQHPYPAAKTLPTAARPARAGLVVLVSECIFLAFFIYLPMANNWPALRPPPIWEEALYAAGFVSAALVWLASIAAWLANLTRGWKARIGVLFSRGADQAPILQSRAHPAWGPAEPLPPEQACPSLRRYRACTYAGTSMILCGFVLCSPLSPVAGTPGLDWIVPSGVGVLLVGVCFAAHGSYAALQQSQARSAQELTLPNAPGVRTELTAGPAMPFWIVLLIAGVLFIGFSKALGIW